MPLFSNISSMEANFASELKSAMNLYFDEVDSIYPAAIGLRPKLNKIGQTYDSYYFKAEYTKKKIILHSTAGFLEGDFTMLCKENVHMSVPYIIARNGVVYELFDPKYWSFHLGNGTIGGNSGMSKESVAIELSNIGPLIEKGEYLYNSYGSKYCKLIETEAYTIVNEGFRGYKYFATFTNEQYASLNNLINFLINKFNIPFNFLPGDSRVNAFSSDIISKAFSGICTHVNFRSTGKYDLGPYFDWQKITDYTPIIVDKDQEFIYGDEEPVKNVFDNNYGKVPKTKTEQIEENLNKTSTYCSLKHLDSLDKTFSGNTLGSLIIKELKSINWNDYNFTNSNSLRQVSNEAIATGIYNFITSGDNMPKHYSILMNTEGSYVIPGTPPVTVPVVLTDLSFDNVVWPSLNSLKNLMNKYYKDIPDLFKTIFEDWAGIISIKPKEDSLKMVFTKPYSIIGDFKFKFDSNLVKMQAELCKTEFDIKSPGSFEETWEIVEKWLFSVFTITLSGEQNGTNVYLPGGLSTGSSVGGGASIGYALSNESYVYTPVLSTCKLTFINP